MSEKIMEISLRSLEFHLDRGDFQKWIAETLEDKELAEELKNLQNPKPTGGLYGINFSLSFQTDMKSY